VRFFILRAHYRSPLNYSDVHLDDAKASLTRLYTALRGKEVSAHNIDWNQPQAKRFKGAMDDDFNTPEAMAVLFELAKDKSVEALTLMKQLGAILGLLQQDPENFLKGKNHYTLDAEPGQYKISGIDAVLSQTSYQNHSTIYTESRGNISSNEQSIEDMIIKRAEAKKAKNFAEADRIRKELANAGIILEDTPQGTTWRRA
jgi:cysteinyl-tRNA synthetase